MKLPIVSNKEYKWINKGRVPARIELIPGPSTTERIIINSCPDPRCDDFYLVIKYLIHSERMLIVGIVPEIRKGITRLV